MKIALVLMIVVLGLLIGCRTSPESVVILPQESQSADKASLVAILPTGTQTADIIVKYSPNFPVKGWQLTAQNSVGTAVSFQSGTEQSLTHFTLSTQKATGLIAGQTYRFTLRFLYNHTDTLSVERIYTHRIPANWRQRAHIDIEDGDFTGMLAINGVAPAGYSANLLTLRYVDEQSSNYIVYMTDQDAWVNRAVITPITHRLVLFTLTKPGFDLEYFRGLGYTMDDRIPQLRSYTKKFTSPPKLTPDYAGEDGDVAVFTTGSQAFFLTQQGSPALWIREYDWTQHRGRDLPEKPGTLATFSLSEKGYVVNQVRGQPPHLWLYDPALDRWVRKADFPGPSRQWGTAFSAAGKGYFGIGLTKEGGAGLRDIWQYDPSTDHWQYVTDYPGQGHRDLIYYSTPSQTFLGWGYESQPAPSGGARLVGCTDFWVFTP